MKKFRFYITLLFFLFCLFAASNVKAMTITYNDIVHNLPDLPTVSQHCDGVHYAILHNSKGYLLFTFSGWVDNDTFFKSSDGNSGGFMGLSDANNNDNGARAYYWHIDNNSWVLDSWQPNTNSWWWYGDAQSSDKYIFSTFTIFKCDPYGVIIPNEIFFQVPPLIVEGTTILAPIVEVQEMKPLAEIVGILPLILVAVVSFLGLRKALQMLSMLLHKS